MTALAVAHDGTTLGRASREFPQHFPQPGWVEHDALEIWQATCDVFAALYADDACDPHAAVALGITNQREASPAIPNWMNGYFPLPAPAG